MNFPIRRVELVFETQVQGQWLDITDAIQIAVTNNGFDEGILTITAKHTTARVVQQEDEPCLHADMWRLLETFAPQTLEYTHDDIGGARTKNVCEGECANGHAHGKALLLPASFTVQVEGGKLVLGTWPRILLLECDAPRTRIVSLSMIGNDRRAAP